ncbi:MAG: sigma-70 family RNA polymerase sigma factor [Acidobacteria bacterium]|nr:sigma-70 family RNA polymerase sigma factor [Acidobacteriota bacterium]
MFNPTAEWTGARALRNINYEPYSRLTPATFEALLANLNADRERAGERYERIRRKLVTFFENRNCEHADGHADEVMDRAARRIHAGASVPDVERYCFGIARVMLYEQLAELRRRREAMEYFRYSLPLLKDPKEVEETEDHFGHLEFALLMLTDAERELILSYYQGEGGGRINHRKELAERYGIPVNALRIRAHRIKVKLQSFYFSLPPGAARPAPPRLVAGRSRPYPAARLISEKARAA